ncbi:hypothetical protein HOLleu_22402 [Holothuria leucospilota]|uniref:Uncharacterized protein n=1 Tax=Holothuria leucospilota TaxID=206669 RepID=A0A9Q1BZ32_HOLLE|nr:hypothetical protein HOLleu_22402 [Holothuria leucospilota]
MLYFQYFVLFVVMSPTFPPIWATSVKFSDHTFDGWMAEFPVTTEKMQSILDKINSESGKNDVKFTLPPLGLMPDNTYVISIAYGKVTYPSLEKVITPELKEKYSTEHDVLHFSFPFLNSEKDPNLRLKFMYITFTGTDDPYVEPNVVMPHLHADQLHVETTEEGIVKMSFVYDDLTLNMTGKISGKCHKPPDRTVEVLDEYVRELTISHIPVDLSVCEDLACIDLQYCKVARQYGSEIKAAGTNVCQFWTSTSSIRRCSSTFHIDYISNDLKEFIGLDDDVVDSIESESFKGLLVDISLRFPCVE